MAHAVVVESNPREGAVLKQAPERIQLRFNVKIEKALTRVSLTQNDKQNIKLPPSDFSKSAPNRLDVRLPPLEPGDYLLRYTVLAADGHTTQGALRFSVAK
ncbi:MAG: copper resistance CopC family protein [Burkholderiales bacterium]